MIFNIVVKEPLPDGARLSMGCNRNSWNPNEEGWTAQKIDDTHYRLEKDLPCPARLEYKWTLQRTLQSNVWNYVESCENGQELVNRVAEVVDGTESFHDVVVRFRNTGNRSTVTRGTLVGVDLKMAQYGNGSLRRIRIWLPDGYDPGDASVRYPVLYMHDGQNLFDSYTSYLGEWELDESMGRIMDSGCQGAIIVGIDNSGEERYSELSPPWPLSAVGRKYISHPYGDRYSAFVTDTVRNYVNDHYNTRTSPRYTGIGGSSMGGAISFYMAVTYPGVYGYALVFSPSLQVFEEGAVQRYVRRLGTCRCRVQPALYLYSGGTRRDGDEDTPYDEACIRGKLESLYECLLDCGYPKERLALCVDECRSHSEAAWAGQFTAAYRWLSQTVMDSETM